MNASPDPSDLLRPFQLEASGLRGRAVRLDAALNDILDAHDYPRAVSLLLAELLLLAGALAGGLKFTGTLSLQIRGDGPVRLMVADIRNDGVLRGYASFDADRLEGGGTSLAGLTGAGVLAMTVDQRPSGGEVYQGIVELDGSSLQESVLAYFDRSEQVPTGIRAAVRIDPMSGRWIGGALMLQAMPGEGGQSAREREEDWRRAMILLAGATADELVDTELTIDRLLFRLFHEDGVRVFEPLPIRFGCTCGEDRVLAVLQRFDEAERRDMLKEDGLIHVTCEFCNRAYRFDPEHVALAAGGSSGTRH